MSDPVTNVEIEDVLSSIRRLVSSEQRDESDDGDRTEGQGERRENKLVLTPAQRVDDPPEVDETEDETRDDSADYEAHGAAEDVDRFAGIEDAEIVEAGEEPEAAAEEHELEPEPEIARSEVPEFLRRAAFDRRAEAAGHPRDQAEAQALSDIDAPDETQAGGHEADNDNAAAELDTELESELDGIEPEAIDMTELEARVAGFETAVAEQDDEWEPDGDEGPAAGYAAGPVEPLPWQDEDQDRPRAGRAAQGAEDDREEDGAWYADDAILDEAALRDMVSEIVRQELQGALGERITRNVRKLVRREIHRALMSQGID